MTTEARTNLGPPATSPTHTPRNTHRLVTRSGCGDNLRPRRSDTPRTAASPANRWSTDGPQTVQRLAAHFGLFRRCHDHRCRNKTRASSNRRRRTIIGLSAASTHLGPRRQPATSTSRHTSGHCHLHQQTVQGLAAHFDHLPATAATCHPGVQTHLGRPPFSPADGFRAYCPQPVHHRRAAIRCRHCCHCCLCRQIRGPFPDKTHLSRHDKQAYQKRIRTGAERRRNGSAIRRPKSCGLLRRPASILAAASRSPL